MASRINIGEQPTLPGFLIVGAAKSGTTSLYAFLREHPLIWMPANKEPNYFSMVNEQGSITSIEEYRHMFQGGRNHLCGEASVSYLPCYNNAIPKIKELLNDPKIIIVLREPTARAFSHYTYFCQLGIEKNTFEAVLSDDYRVIGDPWGGIMNPYIEPGRYYKQVKAYKDAFSHVRVYLYEDLADSKKLGADLFEFLGVEQLESIDIQMRNVSGRPRFWWVKLLLSNRFVMHKIVRYLPQEIKEPLRRRLLRKSEMPLTIKNKLQDIYRDDVLQLEQLIGRDLSVWRYR